MIETVRIQFGLSLIEDEQLPLKRSVPFTFLNLGGITIAMEPLHPAPTSFLQQACPAMLL
jgi:hypothetical protein